MRLRELEKESEWRRGSMGGQGAEAMGWPEEEKRRRRRREGSEWSCTILESSRTAAIGPPKGAAATMWVERSRRPITALPTPEEEEVEVVAGADQGRGE
jgi:hypothetical protein